MLTMPVDAIPDLSENQVIVFTDWMGRSPQEIEDQVTYPLSVSLQGLAGVKVVRSSSEFNFSMITIIFTDATDYYFARQRVQEKLAIASTFLPPGVTPYMAPDATALGQIFWYTVEGDGKDLGQLRSIQDWYVRYQLNSVPGVAEVAIGRRRTPRVPDRYRPEQAPRLRHQPGRDLLRRGPVELVRRRPGHPSGERRVPDPLGRLDPEPSRHREHGRHPAERDTDLRQATGRRADRPGVPPERAREGRQGGGRRRGLDALRREPARGHPADQGEDHGAAGRASRTRGCGSSRFTTARP